ncbi:kinase-associated lipoprotein B [Metabacillus malikii]|uniref:Kinase-associated protein B n=1 Tax=Metabacillus malikii TaxID=1504265 RepID=A0ABT9ZBZ9_9BACI|nr:kinase-associated lipoprotein B [Metabacillus malikii]MDQ0229795.1 kinase-associated protein B [Metabacillus malikii]
MEEFKIGDIVTGIYKTGKYIGEITAIKPMHYLVKVKAVLKHPQQGDLHNPKQADVELFHERRALALNEQTNIPKKMVKCYEGTVPDYNTSLRDSLQHLMNELEDLDTEWATRSLQHLSQLEKDYFPND